MFGIFVFLHIKKEAGIILTRKRSTNKKREMTNEETKYISIAEWIPIGRYT